MPAASRQDSVAYASDHEATKEVRKVREACFCGRVGEIEDRDPVSLDGGGRALRCECGHLERLAWLSSENREEVFEEAERRKARRGFPDAA